MGVFILLRCWLFYYSLKDMQQRSLRDKFSEKEEELFELHLQLSNSSRPLFEDLLRKNNEIIKLCLGSYAEVTSRLDDYDTALHRLDQEIGRIGDTHSNFHFEFRRTHLEAEKRHSQLVNDVSMIKNALKIPGKDAPPEVYLSSDFFKSRASKVLPRNGREVGRARTNFFLSHPSKPEPAEAVSECLQSNSIQTEHEERPPSLTTQKQQLGAGGAVGAGGAGGVGRGTVKHAYTTMEDEAWGKSVWEKGEPVLTRQEMRVKLKEVEARVEERIREVEGGKEAEGKETCECSAPDYVQIYRHIQEQIALHLATKADKQYLQASLLNLNQAWQAEQQNICLQLEAKAEEKALKQVAGRLEGLAQMVERLKEGRNGFDLVRSINHTPMPSIRAGSRDNLAESQVLAHGSPRVDETRLSYKKCSSSAFSNSLVEGRREKHINVDSLCELNESAVITQKAWKERVGEMLGEGKSIKRAKLHH